jgi:hypothetical protein
MRILFLLNNVSKSRHFEGVIQLLAERGHTIILAAERQRNRPLWLPKNLTYVNRDLIARRAPGRIEVTPCPVRRVDRWRDVAPALRNARDYLRFMDPRYGHAGKLERRSAGHAPAAWVRFVQARPWVAARWRMLARLFAAAETAIPTETLFDLYLRYEQPDIVLVTPLVDYGSYQTDYVKSAHRLGIPVVFVPFSWDNLTNRGLIRVAPDRILVWNEIQKREATDLHDIDESRIAITGAPRFDEFFAMQPSTTRAQFFASVGLDAAKPAVLYMCSSEFVAPYEVDFVRRWIQALRQSADPVVRSAGVIVRPHPAHLKPWKNVTLESQVALWSGKENMNADQGLYDSLFHVAACVGLNTSAMIEAGILGKPVFTLVTDEFAGGQEQTFHFHYLRASNGGLLTEARTLDEHVEQLARVLRGEDHAARTRQFIEHFVRPHGLDIQVAPRMVEEIERAARMEKRPHQTPAWVYGTRAALRLALALRRSPAISARRAAETRASR